MQYKSIYCKAMAWVGILLMAMLCLSCKKKKGTSKKSQSHSHSHGHSHGHGHGKSKGRPSYSHRGMQHDFRDVKRWVRVFDNPKRKAWQKPAEVVKLMSLKEGMSVADIGAGTGYFLPYLRAGVGSKGKVWGLDLAAPLVKHMNQRAKKAGWSNVKAVQVSPNDPKLKAKSVDRILIVNTWHHIGRRVEYAKKLKASLKPGGSLFVVDFTMEAKRGPGKKHRLTPTQVSKELTLAGFKVSVAKETLPEQYIVKAE